MTRSFWLVLVALAGLVPAGLRAQTPLPAAGEVVLLPGDSLDITVWRNAELTGRFLVETDSTLAHPLYNEIKVGGIPFGEVKLRLQRFLATFADNPQFTAVPSQKVLVSASEGGASFESFGAEVTISQALLLGGATPETLRRSRLHLIRGGREYVYPLKTEPMVLTLPVRSGDQLILRRGITPTATLNRALSTMNTVVGLVTMYLLLRRTTS